MSSDFTSTAKPSNGDSEEFQSAQRAFEGACWILGIEHVHVGRRG